MTILRRAVIALLLAATMLAAGAANAASTTNFSDQWWIPTESGWGASVLQQSDTLFIDLFVYGADGKPTWFTAAATFQASSPGGHAVFAGDLYLTGGPYFGGAWNPAAVGYRKVGTLTFDAPTVNDATLTYTVDGALIVKNVTRQLWRYENVGGNYFGAFIWDQACGPQGTARDHIEIFVSFQVTHSANNSISIAMQATGGTENGVPVPIPANSSFTFNAPYTQSGHAGQAQGTVAYVSGTDTGTMTWNLFEIERSINGITGRFNGTATSPEPCSYDGRFGGVLR